MNTDAKAPRPPAPIVPAATVLLVRDGEAGLEVFMVQRHHQIDFASGALVFPGGKVDKADYHAELRAATDGADGLDDLQLALRLAAIREAFEESGILLARDSVGGPLLGAGRLADLEPRWREPMRKGEVPLIDMVQAEGLRLAADVLVHYAHWITPPMMPKRFDTHFYLACAPAEQLALHDGHESVESVWIDPNEAVADALARRRTIIFPTRLNLEKLACHACVDDALTTTRAGRVVTVLPEVRESPDGPTLCITPDAGYATISALLKDIG